MHPSSWHVNNRELVAEDRVTLNSSSLSETVFFLCHKRMATCSSQFYWNKARTGLAYRRTSLYCRKFAFYRNSDFCPWNTFPRANVVGSPCSYPVMAVVEVTDVAHPLPLHAFIGWSVRELQTFLPTPRTPPQDSMASFNCVAVSMSCPEFSCTAMCDLIVAALRSHAPFLACDSERSIWEM